jgi:hypothetical protein
MSRTRESQPPIVLGAEMVTVGDTAEAELRTPTLMVLRAFSQLVVSHELDWHCAFTTASMVSDTGESTATQPTALLTNAFTCRLLTQTQVDALAQAKLNRAEQVNCVATFPLSVLESNAMAMYEPSSANVADDRTGANIGAAAETTLTDLVGSVY